MGMQHLLTHHSVSTDRVCRHRTTMSLRHAFGGVNAVGLAFQAKNMCMFECGNFETTKLQ